jgi:hypothetical protein
MKYIIKTESTFAGRTCNLGDGETEKAAWVDAFGPKPWSDYAKRNAKKAWCVKIESDEPVSYSGYRDHE